MDSEWEDVLREELAQDELAHQMHECDFIRTPSTADMSENERGEGGESSGGSSGRRLPSTWWAAVLKAAGRHLGFDDISLSQSEHVNVLSACTGCSAESWVLKAGPSKIQSVLLCFSSTVGLGDWDDWELLAGLQTDLVLAVRL